MATPRRPITALAKNGFPTASKHFTLLDSESEYRGRLKYNIRCLDRSDEIIATCIESALFIGIPKLHLGSGFMNSARGVSTCGRAQSCAAPPQGFGLGLQEFLTGQIIGKDQRFESRDLFGPAKEPPNPKLSSEPSTASAKLAAARIGRFNLVGAETRCVRVSLLGIWRLIFLTTLQLSGGHYPWSSMRLKTVPASFCQLPACWDIDSR